jgi:hypothetical protein
MERLSETQYWFVVAAVGLTPMLTFWIIDIVGWFLRRVFVLWIGTAPIAMLAPPQARRSGPGGAADPEGSVDMDSNASFAGEVEHNVSRDNDSLLRGQPLKMPPLVVE